ncbi:MAG: cellobiose phosphorylase [Candidatus Omnitrophica bacterium]|nr:cellobiose phosphorylase [Candidatus Omnitrophota bacterium]
MPRVADQSKKSIVRQSGTGLYDFLPDGVSFVSQKAFNLRQLYFPLCGVDAGSVKSAISPRLSGDIKFDAGRYLTKPVSIEDLRQDMRNFFCYVKGRGIVSLTSGDGVDAAIEAGMLWHKLKRVHKDAGLEIEALNFVPVTNGNIELMRVTVRNISREKRVITPTFSLPIFGRALAHKQDHEHVTSLLNRIEQLPYGVCVKPTMAFDERRHKANETIYYVLGIDSRGRNPAGTFPTAESFYGEGGDVEAPEAVTDNRAPTALPKEKLDGKEAVGALRFGDEALAPGESRDYLIFLGAASDRKGMVKAFGQFNSTVKYDKALEENKTYWAQKSRAIHFSTGDPAVDAWMRWVSLQPVLRRIFGCSFLPEHDYGKGGKGWRDIWQDLLSVVLIEPKNARKVLADHFAGVRIDGSNATIIGSVPGEFLGDRNAITRVWMDHGVWPLITLLLYTNQTGDYDILLEENTYFRDAQLSRANDKDYSRTADDAHWLTDQQGGIYKGTIIEHLLVEHLAQFFNVGEHNIIRLEAADWNDGLDMARERGESVAFTSFYGGNLLALADLLEDLSSARGVKEIQLAAEVQILLDTLAETPADYNDWKKKRELLIESYFPSVQPSVSGERVMVSIGEIAKDLRAKGQWIFDHVRRYEVVDAGQKGRTHQWFNGYYDNKGERVEGMKGGHARMTLAGQVFPIFSGLANEKEIESIIGAVKTYLWDEGLGGLRLNTDFHVEHYLDLGRAFGFAYGTKENGSFFNHMSIMYACALYKRGYVSEGYNILSSVYRMCADSGRNKTYPGIPEYFDSEGRGHYHYLTGSASWLVLMKLVDVFGVRGEKGDLLISPKLVKEEFDPQTGVASATCPFAGRKVSVTYENPKKLDYGAYKIVSLLINGKPVEIDKGSANAVKIKRAVIESAPEECDIKVVLR